MVKVWWAAVRRRQSFNSFPTQVDVKGKILRDGQAEDGPESDLLVESEISVDQPLLIHDLVNSFRDDLAFHFELQLIQRLDVSDLQNLIISSLESTVVLL